MKKTVNITSEYGIVIRKEILVNKNISSVQLVSVFENAQPLDENEKLISYGPHFGAEAMEEFGKRLSQLGLEYMEDFFYFYGDFPEWVRFSVKEIR